MQMVASNDVNAVNPAEELARFMITPAFWCHVCEVNVPTVINVDTEEVECQSCGGCFVEQIEEDGQDRPQDFMPAVEEPEAQPSPSESNEPLPSTSMNLSLLDLLGMNNDSEQRPNTNAGGEPFPQMISQMLTQVLGDVGSRNRNSDPTGRNPVGVFINAGGSAQALPVMSALFQFPAGTSLGDFRDGNIQNILNHIMQHDTNQYGAPPASKETLDNLPILQITQKEVDAKEDCAVCKDEFQLDEEIRRLPCVHDFHPDCILPWLKQHNSCPVCRFELPTDDEEYEQRRQHERVNEAAHGSSN